MTDGKPVLVVGGGIGGMATALALAQRGLACHILERRAQPSEDGAGIQIGPNGVKVLRRLGVADALEARVGVPDAIRVRSARNGRDLSVLPLGRWIEERHGAPYWVAHRADVHAVLADAVKRTSSITFETGFAVSSVTSTNDGITAVADNGEVREGRALIGADGLWSSIRAQHFDDGAPQLTGLAAARAVVPAGEFPVEFARTETGVWLLPGAHIVHYPVRRGTEIAVVLIFKDDTGGQSWSAPMPRETVARLGLRHHGSIGDVIGAILSWTRWPLVTRLSLAHWSKGRMALLGDAAHPVLPFLAQGAVMALEDAVTLADCMAAPGVAIDDALADYQSKRIARCARVANAAARNGRIYHLGGPAAAIRDTVLRAAPGARVMGSYDWLYGFNAADHDRSL